MSVKYVGYYRVSTQQQGRSGLGLESQRNAVREHANANGTLIGEYEEVVSGNSTKHTVLDEALAQAKREKACLLVKRLDTVNGKQQRGVDQVFWGRTGTCQCPDQTGCDVHTWTRCHTR